MVFQSLALFPHLSVGDNIAYPLAIRGVDKATRMRRAEELLELVRLPGVALAHPGPQGTPFLFQAGASSRGRRFALEHAEAVFYIGPTTAHVRRFVEQTREGLREAGRPEDAIRVLAMVTVVVADTDEEAQARLAEYHEHVDVESALALLESFGD